MPKETDVSKPGAGRSAARMRDSGLATDTPNPEEGIGSFDPRVDDSTPAPVGFARPDTSSAFTGVGAPLEPAKPVGAKGADGLESQVEAAITKLNRAVDRFENHVRPELETKYEKVSKALDAAKAALEAIEQLPNENADQRGPLARAALEEIKSAKK